MNRSAIRAIFSLLFYVAAFFACATVRAQNALVRVQCDEADKGAEVSIDSKFKGECPIDVGVSAGTVKLRVVKKVDATHERVFEQEFRVGDGVVKRVEAVFSAPRLNADAQATEDRRLGPERAEAARRERIRQSALPVEPRRDDASLALLRIEAEARVAAFKRSVAYTSASAVDAAEIVRILLLPIENLRNVNLADPAGVHTFIERDSFFETTGGSEKTAESYKENISGGEMIFKVNHARSGRFVQTEGRVDFPAYPGHFLTYEGQDALAGLVGYKGNASKNNVPQARVELTQIESVFGQPFPLAAGKRFGLTSSQTTTGIDAGVKKGMFSCAVSSLGPTQSAAQSVSVSCLQQRENEPDYYSLQRFLWLEACGCFVKASQ